MSVDPRTLRAKDDWCRAGAEIMRRALASFVPFPTAAAVIRERGKSEASFNSFWRKHGGKEGFDRALADYLARQERFSELPAITGLLADITNAVDLATALRNFCKQDFALIVESDGNAGVLALLGGSGDRRHQALLRRLYHQLDTYLEETVAALLQARSLEPCPPITVKGLVTMVNQLCDGLTLRARFDPDCATPVLYADALAALLIGSLRKHGSTKELAERVNEELG